MEYDVLTNSNDVYGMAVKGIVERLKYATEEGWKAQGGINVTYDSQYNTFYANLLIGKEIKN